MSFNENLADRIRRYLNHQSVDFEEKKMMGGLCFMVDDKMCMGIMKDDLMVRTNPEDEAEALEQRGARPMDFTGRPMRGYLFIDETGMGNDQELAIWLDRCLAFNPLAKSSKKKQAKKTDFKK